MGGQKFYTVKKTRNGKWRLYKTESQALMSWRGDNDKTTVVRDDHNKILNFTDDNTAREHCNTVFGSYPFKD